MPQVASGSIDVVCMSDEIKNKVRRCSGMSRGAGSGDKPGGRCKCEQICSRDTFHVGASMRILCSVEVLQTARPDSVRYKS
jgi:hypothetical protein